MKRLSITVLLAVVFFGGTAAMANAQVLSLSDLVELLIKLEIIAPEKAEQARQAVKDPAIGDAQASAPKVASFVRDLSLGSVGEDVRLLQQILNRNSQTRIAETGIGSPGSETTYFGSRTQAAVIKFQNLHSAEILVPAKISQGTGYAGPRTSAKIEQLVAPQASIVGNSATTSEDSLAKQGPPSITPSGTTPATPATPAIPSGGGGGGGSATPALPATPAQTSDITPPIISNIQATPSGTGGVLITWETDESADSRVVYSATTSSTTYVKFDASPTRSHSLEILNATSAIGYYSVSSADAAGNISSSSEQVISVDFVAIALQNIKNNSVFTNAVSTLTNNLEVFQAEYASLHGTHWQAFYTHDVVPAYNLLTAPTNLADSPSDAPSWLEIDLVMPEALPFSVKIDVYHAPCGLGYRITYKTSNWGFIFHKNSPRGM